MGKIKEFILNRKQYDKIRKMDHCQMTMWAESIYKSGYKDGKEAAEADLLTIDQVRECLLTLKGFGEKRVSAICGELQRKMSHHLKKKPSCFRTSILTSTSRSKRPCGSAPT